MTFNSSKLLKTVATIGCMTLMSTSLQAAIAYNINVGAGTGSGGAHEITTADNYLGAAAENTVNSTWNAVTQNTTGQTLLDSTGATSAITLDFTSNTAYGARTLNQGNDKIFTTHTGTAGSVSTATFNGLDNSVVYELIIYSDWAYAGGDSGLAVTQTVGNGLLTNFVVNHNTNLGTSPLTEDTNPANVSGNTNWFRATHLKSTIGGQFAFQLSNDAPVSGFQLIAVPEPSSSLLSILGLSFLAIRRRR